MKEIVRETLFPALLLGIAAIGAILVASDNSSGRDAQTLTAPAGSPSAPYPAPMGTQS